MKGKFYKSSYALNRNKKAIVYENADGTILEITFEKIAAGNPNFTEEDFEKLKEFSDQMYLEEQRSDVTVIKSDMRPPSGLTCTDYSTKTCIF